MASTRNYYCIKTLTFIISIACSCPLLYGQTKGVAIKSIRETVQKINTDKTLKTVKLENEEVREEVPDNGLSLTGYVRKNAINKIDYWVGLSYCIKQYSFYLNDKGQLIFIYETERDFPENKQGGLNDNKTVLAFEGRYYINDDKAIDIKLNGKKRMAKSPSAKEIKDLMSDAKSYVKLLSGRIKR